MRYRGMSRAHLFLIEMIIVALFFSFAGAITVQVFSKAHQLAQDATALNGAFLAAQTAAETDKTKPFQDLDLSPEAEYFDKDWEITDRSDSVYVLKSDARLEQRTSGVMAVYDYSVTSDDNTIYRLQAKKYYFGETVGETAANEGN